MGFVKCTEEPVDCVHCHEPIKLGERMEFYLPPDRGAKLKPAHQSCNEKAYAQEEADAR